MIKYNYDCDAYFYYEDDKHILTKKVSNDMAATIISNLILSQDFQCDQTISTALYKAMRKLQGFSDEDINRLC